MKEAGFEVLENDISHTEGKDFLLSEIPDCDVIVTNPPFAYKREFFIKCLLSQKPFFLLLPTETLQCKGLNAGFLSKGIKVGILVPSPAFLINGQRKAIVNTSWFIGNIPNQVSGLIDMVFFPTMNMSRRLALIPTGLTDIMNTQASQEYEASPRICSEKAPLDGIAEASAYCDHCGSGVDEIVGTCSGMECIDKELCKVCANFTEAHCFCPSCFVEIEEEKEE